MAIVQTDDVHYHGMADAIRSMIEKDTKYTPAEMVAFFTEGGKNVKPWNIPEGITIMGVPGTLKLGVTPGDDTWPFPDADDTDPSAPPSEDAMDEAVQEDDPDVNIEDKMVLVDNEGNITVGYLYTEMDSDKDATQEDLAGLGAAAVTAAINGTTATIVFSGMGAAAATNGIVLYMDAYAAATGVAASGSALASTIATGILVAGGTLLVGAAAAALIGGFIDWLREQEGLQAGGNSVTVSFGSDTGYFLKTFNGLIPCSYYNPDIDVFFVGDIGVFLSAITSEPFLLFTTPDGSPFCVRKGSDRFYFSLNGVDLKYVKFTSIPNDAIFVSLGRHTGQSSNYSSLFFSDISGNYLWHTVPGTSLEVQYATTDNFSLQPNEEFQEIPDDIPEGQILSIDTGLDTLPQDDPQAAADEIMQSAIDGSLNPVITIEPYYGGVFTITYYDPVTTEFRAVGWRRVSKHTTGELAGQITKDDFTWKESGGWNYLKNIRSCTREKLYWQGYEIWPKGQHLWNYNGVELPPLPKWDKETYPYAVINNFFGFRLYVFPKTAYYFEASTGWYFGFDARVDSPYPQGNGFYFALDPTNTVWKEPLAAANCGVDPLWSNFDVYTDDTRTTISCAASDPIPV